MELYRSSIKANKANASEVRSDLKLSYIIRFISPMESNRPRRYEEVETSKFLDRQLGWSFHIRT